MLCNLSNDIFSISKFLNLSHRNLLTRITHVYMNTIFMLVEYIGTRKVLSLLTSQGRNLLHLACATGSMKCASTLCRWDADNSPDESLQCTRDKFGKLPMLLLPSHVDRSKLDTLWGIAR